MLLQTLISEHMHLVTGIAGNTNVEVKSIQQDSRLAGPDCVFVAIKGTTNDGHLFIDKVIEQGTRVIIAQKASERALPEGVVWIQTTDSSELLGHLAATWYGHPSKSVTVVGVTGTNGKTTVATLLWQLFTEGGKKCGLISTVENRIGSEVEVSTHTTPDALRLQALLARMRDAECTHVFMEVSSHAVDQRRIAGLQFAGGLFTNLTHDHLDYHGTFAAYLKAKKRFFDDMPPHAWVITNADDRNGGVMVQNTKAQVIRYGLKHSADIKGKVIENTITGLHLQINDREVFARMIGSFNALNILAAYGAALQLGMDEMTALTILSNLRGAEGRFEYVGHATLPECAGIVDYAHTPDALEKVIQTILGLLKNGGRLITVVGCGGNRDKAKRPVMAQIAVKNSFLTVLTSDNPRMEEPEDILADMEAGLAGFDQSKWLTISDRKQAIKTACKMVKAGDVILVAGKGHEKYQEIKGIKHPFDDVEVLSENMK